MENSSNLYTQNVSDINGRHVWHYLLSTTIGNFSVVAWETRTLEIKRVIYDENYDKAVSKYETICRQMISGKI